MRKIFDGVCKMMYYIGCAIIVLLFIGALLAIPTGIALLVIKFFGTAMLVRVIIALGVLGVVMAMMYCGVKASVRNDPHSRNIHTTESNIKVGELVSYDVEQTR